MGCPAGVELLNVWQTHMAGVRSVEGGSSTGDEGERHKGVTF